MRGCGPRRGQSWGCEKRFLGLLQVGGRKAAWGLPRHLSRESAADMGQGLGLEWGPPSRRRHQGRGRWRVGEGPVPGSVADAGRASEGTSPAACFPTRHSQDPQCPPPSHHTPQPRHVSTRAHPHRSRRPGCWASNTQRPSPNPPGSAPAAGWACLSQRPSVDPRVLLPCGHTCQEQS